jgi:hypothetical protein
MNRPQHGRRVVITSTVVLLGMNLFVIVLSQVVYQIGNPGRQLVRFFICALFCVLMVMGRSWARWVVVVLYTGSGVGALLTAFSEFTEGWAGFPLLAIAMAYLTPVLLLAFSPAVKAFFSARRIRGPDQSIVHT